MNADHKLVDKFSRSKLIGLVSDVWEYIASRTDYNSENLPSAAH